MINIHPGDPVRIIAISDVDDPFSHYFDLGQEGKVIKTLKPGELFLVECDGFQQAVKADYLERADEVWRDVEGYEGIYQVSNLGQVYNISTGHMLTPSLRDANTCVTVGLHKNGRSRNVILHRLVAEAFIPNPQKLPYIIHKNGNITDNTAANLEWSARVSTYRKRS